MRIDVHQHAWSEPLLDALAHRRALPYVEERDGVYVLHSAGERPYVIDLRRGGPEVDEELQDEGGLDAVIVAISSPIGIETLPRADAEALIEAHLSGVGQLGEAFRAWGPLALEDRDPDDVDALLDRGCVGISLPAGALAGADAVQAMSPVLERIAAHDVPLFVHPGPPPSAVRWEASLSEPLWWRALTDYVAQMQAAWLSFTALARREHPDLVAVFAMLAGGAPLQAERLQTRGGPEIDLHDPRVFYDTSSYGPAMIEATARRVGLEQLVYGSDRPVLQPLRTEHDGALQANAARLLSAARAAA